METLAQSICNTWRWLVQRKTGFDQNDVLFWGLVGDKNIASKKEKKVLPTKTPLMLYVLLNYYVTRVFIRSTETLLVINIQFSIFLDVNKTPRGGESVTTLPNANRGRQILGSVSLVSKCLGYGKTGTQRCWGRRRGANQKSQADFATTFVGHGPHTLGRNVSKS